MFTTANETQTRTLTRLIKAMDAQHPATITYTKADRTQTIRTIEIYDITTSKAGDILLKAMDRETGETRSFRLDRIAAYTIHRTAYTVPRPVVDAPSGHGLAASTPRVALLTPATITTSRRLDALAALLAA